MVHARLYLGADNSGKLVNRVRNEARHLAEQRNLACVLVDGPPGLGCPVIASITGATAVLVVTEPTLSGRHDLERTLALTDHFNIPAFICVNKWDINPQMTERIEQEAQAAGAASLGRIPYDVAFTQAHSNGRAVVDYTAGPLQRVIKHIWTQLIQAIDTRSDSS
jgi:MinD superfamily P-loop ATPase